MNTWYAQFYRQLRPLTRQPIARLHALSNGYRYGTPQIFHTLKYASALGNYPLRLKIDICLPDHPCELCPGWRTCSFWSFYPSLKWAHVIPSRDIYKSSCAVCTHLPGECIFLLHSFIYVTSLLMEPLENSTNNFSVVKNGSTILATKWGWGKTRAFNQHVL